MITFVGQVRPVGHADPGQCLAEVAPEVVQLPHASILQPSHWPHLLYLLGLLPFLMLPESLFWTIGAVPYLCFPLTTLLVHSLSLQRSGVFSQALQEPQGSALHPSHSLHLRPLASLGLNSCLSPLGMTSVSTGSLQWRALQRCMNPFRQVGHCPQPSVILQPSHTPHRDFFIFGFFFSSS